MDFKCKFEVSGKVLEVGEVQTFSSGFQKRTIVVEASKDAEKFSNPIQLTLKKDQVSLADTLNVGDGITAEGFVEGRKWEKDGNVRYFIDLNTKSIMVTDKCEKPTTAKSWKELVALGAAYGENEEAVKDRCRKFGKGFKDMTAEDWQKLAEDIVAAHQMPSDDEIFEDGDDMPF